jgi:hypothetical protein
MPLEALHLHEFQGKRASVVWTRYSGPRRLAGRFRGIIQVRRPPFFNRPDFRPSQLQSIKPHAV